MSRKDFLLVYDPECPVCDAYCRALARQGSRPGLELVDARGSGGVMEEITRRGLDIDEGMVVSIDGDLSYGAEAIRVLAALGGTASALDRANRWLFGSPRRARYLYPLLRTGRNLLLKALRRTRVNNLQIPGRDRF